MKIVDDIKQRAGNYVFQSLKKNNKRVVEVCNMEHAEHIGIVFNATSVVNFEIIRQLVKDLNGKNISSTTLGYVDSDVLVDHYLIRKGFDFFTHKDLNWHYRPVGDKIKEFVNQEFDILINLSLEKFLPIDFVILESRARFKVGKMFSDHIIVDLMIDTSKEIEKINQLKEEIRKDKEANGEVLSEDNDLNEKSIYEMQLNYLIHQVFHYLSIIRSGSEQTME